MAHTHDWGLLYTDQSECNETAMWGFAGQFPGPTIVVERDKALEVQWTTNLAGRHLLSDSLDTTLDCLNKTVNCSALSGNEVRFAIHVHGSPSRPESDGMLGAWFTKNFKEVGPTWRLRALAYPNNINSTLLWYHDHAAGITRLNHYAGLSGLYIIRDAFERTLVRTGLLPDTSFELPLIIEDRNFNPDGSLAYDCDLFVDGSPSILPEFFGPYIAVNGVLWPTATVQARRYRLRVLNNADSRFFNLTFVRPSGQTLLFWLVGGDHGFLPTPVPLRSIVLGPAERADIVINFTPFAGEKILLTNSAAAPYPGGDPPTTATSSIMQFQVGGGAVAAAILAAVATEPASSLKAIIPPLNPTQTRKLGLFETQDQFGRIFPLLGTVAAGPLRFGDPVTEIVRAGVPEEWEIYNWTQDTHPVHLHFARFRVISRRSFTTVGGSRQRIVLGKQLSAQPGDSGLKDTIKVDPGTVLKIHVQFDIPGEYMWHCHIFSHEDHEMSRPILVLP